FVIFFFQAEDGIRDSSVTGVQTCALPISVNANLQFRVPDTITGSLGLANTMQFKHSGAPAWRTGNEVDLATWNASELTVSPAMEIGRASCRERGRSRACAGGGRRSRG